MSTKRPLSKGEKVSIWAAIIIFVVLIGVFWAASSLPQTTSGNNGQVSSDDATSTAEANAAATTFASVDATSTAVAALIPTPSTVSVDLLTAVNQQLVTVSFASTGSASGDVIDITLHRFKSPNSDIQVTLPPGLLLTNSDPSEQNMVLLQVEGVLDQPGASSYTPATVMELAPGETDAYYVVAAYCANLHKSNPSSGRGLMLSGQGSPDLVSLMKTEQSRNDELLVIQAAVWAITDNATSYDLNQVGYKLSDQELQSVRDLLRAAGLNPANYQLTA